MSADVNLETQSLSVEQYILQLCRLIVREGQNQALRRSYELMLQQLRARLVRTHPLY
ncbi:hypothetical protein HZU75_09280 [Chitinibacter fontanus]|uniref:Uncharacterized protein n=1 Tax=Chitinibacter fontanus TaxID=1737446 RepID=A0A7D5ZH12_9NEIS|nr:hypothetical protein [Chitinibacter fontanus]QLI81707.1 hypothetical protein HZU75_09280 [Chitinibacter fontanus]